MGRPIGITALVNFKGSSTRLVYCRSSRNRIIRNSFSRAGWWGGFSWASWGHQYKVIFCANRSSAHSSPSDQYNTVSPVQFSHSVMSDSLRPHEWQHTRPPCPSPTPRFYSDSLPSSQWCHPAISSSVVHFSSCPHPSQHQSLFQWVNSSHEVAKVLEFQL